MRYAVVGGDMRFVHLARMLDEGGRPTACFLQEKAGGKVDPMEQLRNYSCIIANWPVKQPLAERECSMEEIMGHIAPGSSLLLCGPEFPKERRWDLQYENIWDDAGLLEENAYLTAEGAVAAVMAKSQCCLRGMEALVIGYGRIGRALAEILQNVGVRVTVATGSGPKRRQIEDSGARSVRMESVPHAVRGKNVIFSTPPAEVIPKDALGNVGRDAMLMDLASPPFGFDLDAAQALGLNAWREPGLPGRYCPVSAARAVYHAILRWEESQHG